MKWSDRTVLVTGATGIIGSWLVDSLLRNGAKVVAFIRDHDQNSQLFRSQNYKKVITVDGRLEDYDVVENAINQFEVDTVFHLAAQPLVRVAHRSPLPTFEANIRGTYHVLESCRRLGSGLVKKNSCGLK